MGHSLMIAGCLMGMDVRIGAPKSLWPSDDYLQPARAFADQYGARLTLTEDPVEAVEGCDFVNTDVWVSMGEPEDVWQERIELLSPYQVNTALMQATGNAAAKFMHCLPAFHNTETKVGKEIFEAHGIAEMEVTDEVFESAAGIQFEQAENRLHTIKAILVATIGN